MRWRILGLVALVSQAVPEIRADEPPAAVTVLAIHPDAFADRVIGLFQGARVPDPASALAAWVRAEGRRGRRAGLGKRIEAAIVALNPATAREFASLDGGEFVLDADLVHWRAVLPNDDGSLAAFTVALALTEGGSEAPLGDLPVLRLGAEGSALAASRHGRLALAVTRDGLRQALDAPRAASPPGTDPGWLVRIDPAALHRSQHLSVRRLAGALDAAGSQEMVGRLALVDETITLDLTSRPGAGPGINDAADNGARLDPSWLAAVPAEGVLASWTLALDREARAVNVMFALLDRVERADPARAGVAPLRTRLNLLAALARVRPEIDLWPDLRGLTGCLLVDARGRMEGVLVALHTADAETAARIAGRIVPRLAASYAGGQVQVDPANADPTNPRSLGMLNGRPLAEAIRGRTILIGWGDRALAAGLDAWDQPSKSAAARLKVGWGTSTPQRAGAFWVGRLERLKSAAPALAGALADAPPVLWQGTTVDGSAHDLIHWTGLRGVVRRWLDALPLEP